MKAAELVEADALLEAGKLQGELVMVRSALEKDPSNAKLLERLEKLQQMTDPKALLKAAQALKPKTLERLLRAGVDPNGAVDEVSALAEAASWVRPASVALLLEHGANPKYVGRWQRTPVHFALVARDNINVREVTERSRIVELLLAAGADPHARCKQGRTVFWLACNLGRGKATGLIAQLLERGPDLLARDLSDFSILHMAARWGLMAVLKAALAAGADPNHCFEGDRNALTLAIYSGHEEAARVLIAAGAKPSPG